MHTTDNCPVCKMSKPLVDEFGNRDLSSFDKLYCANCGYDFLAGTNE